MRQRLVRTLRHECCVPICCRRDRGCRAFFPFHSGHHHARCRPRRGRAVRADVPSGTIVVSTNERRLYLVLGQGRAMVYPVGVGRAGRQWAGRSMIDSKRIAPAWGPPPDIKREHPEIAGRHSRRLAEKSDGRRSADVVGRRNTPSTAPTIRARSAATSPTAASGCTTRTSPICTIASASARR